MAKYDITSEAKEDLYRIWEYTVDTWSEEQADKYYAILESAFNEIASVENKPGKSYDEIMSGLKAYHIRRHMIFYLCNIVRELNGIQRRTSEKILLPGISSFVRK